MINVKSLCTHYIVYAYNISEHFKLLTYTSLEVLESHFGGSKICSLCFVFISEMDKKMFPLLILLNVKQNFIKTFFISNSHSLLFSLSFFVGCLFLLLLLFLFLLFSLLGFWDLKRQLFLNPVNISKNKRKLTLHNQFHSREIRCSRKYMLVVICYSNGKWHIPHIHSYTCETVNMPVCCLHPLLSNVTTAAVLSRK